MDMKFGFVRKKLFKNIVTPFVTSEYRKNAKISNPIQEPNH